MPQIFTFLSYDRHTLKMCPKSYTLAVIFMQFVNTAVVDRPTNKCIPDCGKGTSEYHQVAVLIVRYTVGDGSL